MNVGTNDANAGLVSFSYRCLTTDEYQLTHFQVDGAGRRLEALLNDLWSADGMSKTFVVVSSVIRRGDVKAEKNRKEINEQYK